MGRNVGEIGEVGSGDGSSVSWPVNSLFSCVETSF